jgi:hypothetical protein
MGRFKRDFKNYQDSEDTDCYLRTVPNGMADAVAERLIEACGSDSDETTVSNMKAVADDLLITAGKKETTNWQRASLVTEIKSACHVLCEVTFDKFMDGTLNASERLYKRCASTSRSELIGELNEAFTDANFGYYIRESPKDGRLAWALRSDPSVGEGAVAAAIEAVGDISQVAIEHLEQARDHLRSPERKRSRKDAVRDAMSAMEVLLKQLSLEKDIRAATKVLRSRKIWGTDTIVKEGLSLWEILHRSYPDIRHGEAVTTDMDIEEACFWIDRIGAFISYMVARRKLLR